MSHEFQLFAPHVTTYVSSRLLRCWMFISYLMIRVGVMSVYREKAESWRASPLRFPLLGYKLGTF